MKSAYISCLLTLLLQNALASDSSESAASSAYRGSDGHHENQFSNRFDSPPPSGTSGSAQPPRFFQSDDTDASAPQTKDFVDRAVSYPSPGGQCYDKSPQFCHMWAKTGGCKEIQSSASLCPLTCTGACPPISRDGQLNDQNIGQLECTEQNHRRACELIYRGGSCNSDPAFMTTCPRICGGLGCQDPQHANQGVGEAEKAGVNPQKKGGKAKKLLLTALAGAAIGGLAKKFFGHKHKNNNHNNNDYYSQNQPNIPYSQNQPYPAQGQQMQTLPSAYPSNYATSQQQTYPTYSAVQASPSYLGTSGSILGSTQIIQPGVTQYTSSSTVIQPATQYTSVNTVYPASVGTLLQPTMAVQGFDCQKAVASNLCYSPDVCTHCRYQCAALGRGFCSSY